MNPQRFETVGDFLAVRWSDGQESVIPLEELRRNCPCAQCAGETDLTGRVHRVGAVPTFTDASFQVLKWERVGHYAVQAFWADGHETGIFTWDLLRSLGED